MRLSTNRSVIFAVGAAAGVVVGLFAGRSPVIPEAHAATGSFVQTGQLSITGISEFRVVNRYEDKETGIVCYSESSGMGFTCAQKK